jgi:hypothetical protein
MNKVKERRIPYYCRESNPGPSVRNLVTILIGLSPKETIKTGNSALNTEGGKRNATRK